MKKIRVRNQRKNKTFRGSVIFAILLFRSKGELVKNISILSFNIIAWDQWTGSHPRALQEILATVTTLVFTQYHYNWNPISVVPSLLLPILPNDILCGHITRRNKFETSCIRSHISFLCRYTATALMIPPPSALAQGLVLARKPKYERNGCRLTTHTGWTRDR